MDQELDILLDVLESGDTLRFRRMISETEWNWMLHYLNNRTIMKPHVEPAGPLGLAIKLNNTLNLISTRDGSDRTLAIGQLRSTLNQFHQIPSIDNTGFSTSQYCESAVRMALNTQVNPADRIGLITMNSIIAQYLLSSVNTSSCIIKKSYLINKPDGSTVLSRWASIVAPSCIWHFETPDRTFEIYFNMTDPTIGGNLAILSLNMTTTRSSGFGSSTRLLRLDIRRERGKESGTSESIMLPSGVVQCEKAFHDSGFGPYLPTTAMASLLSTIYGIGAYIDHHVLLKKSTTMPVFPYPPTWLSVWKSKT